MGRWRLEWPHWSTSVCIGFLAAIALALCIARSKPPLRITAETKDEEIILAEEIDWNQLRTDMIAADPKLWSTKATERQEQWLDFVAWSSREYGSFPITHLEVMQRISLWLRDGSDDALEIEVVAHGTRYGICCNRYVNGADCEIKLLGFVDHAAPP